MTAPSRQICIVYISSNQSVLIDFPYVASPLSHNVSYCVPMLIKVRTPSMGI
jgi:hypothetical protein